MRTAGPERLQSAASRQLELSGKVGIALLVVPGVLQLTQQQRRIVDPEIHSIPVAQLRIIRSRARLVTVEDAAQN